MICHLLNKGPSPQDRPNLAPSSFCLIQVSSTFLLLTPCFVSTCVNLYVGARRPQFCAHFLHKKRRGLIPQQSVCPTSDAADCPTLVKSQEKRSQLLYWPNPSPQRRLLSSKNTLRLSNMEVDGMAPPVCKGNWSSKTTGPIWPPHPCNVFVGAYRLSSFRALRRLRALRDRFAPTACRPSAGPEEPVEAVTVERPGARRFGVGRVKSEFEPLV